MTVVWVLDREGYDVRGGDARVFSTKELAKAATGRDDINWKPRTGIERQGEEFEDLGDGMLSDNWVIYPVTIDAPGWQSA